jgi:hypothetical protein
LSRKVLSPLLIIAIALMSAIPETPFLAKAQTTATLSANPSFNVGDVGSTFIVEVDLSGVGSLIAYDVSLCFTPAALQAIAVDFDTTTIVAGTSHFNIATTVDNLAGCVRYAVTLLSGTTIDASGTVAILFVTFQVVAAQDSPLNIMNPQVIQLLNGVPVAVDNIVVNNSVFLVPPTILVVPPYSDVHSGERTRRISKGEDHVDLIGYIQLAPNSTRPGFGGVIFDIVGPGGEVQVPSNVAFMFPGNSTTVTGTFFYPLASSSIGTYSYSVFAMRCVTPSACIIGTKAYLSLDGPFFKVKA